MSSRTARSSSISISILTVVCAALATVGIASYGMVLHGNRKRQQKEEEKHKNNNNNNKATSSSSPSDHILVALFQEAAATSTKAPMQGATTNGDKLMLYGLYKQATMGDAPTGDVPSVFHLVAHAKYSAWCKFTGMPRETAMYHYIQAVKELGEGQSISDSDSHSMSFEGPSLGLGMQPSQMVYDEHEFDDAAAESTSLEARLRKAAATDDVLAMKDLIEQGANINATDDHGETALHFCADRGMLDGVIYLMELGADANAEDQDGISVLQAAVIAGHVEVCRILLEEGGADPDHEDNDGDTPRSCALEDTSEKMQALFERHQPTTSMNGQQDDTAAAAAAAKHVTSVLP